MKQAKSTKPRYLKSLNVRRFKWTNEMEKYNSEYKEEEEEDLKKKVLHWFSSGIRLYG